MKVNGLVPPTYKAGGKLVLLPITPMSRPTTLPNELIHSILGYINESDGNQALNACMPVSSQFLEIARSYVWRELQIEPVNVKKVAAKIKPEIARHVRELYIESGLRKTWLRDSKGLGFCLHHDFSKLQKLSLAFVTWASLSAANRKRLHELTQTPAFQDLRIIGVKDMPPTLIVGLTRLRHLVASSITMSTRPISLRPYTGRRTHLKTLSLAWVLGERNDTSWQEQVQGIVNLLSLLLSPMSPISLTELSAISVNIQLLTILRPDLSRIIEGCSETLECLKIRAGENLTHPGTQGLWEQTNEPLYLARHTALKSIFVHIECPEDDRLNFLINTLAPLGPATPLREITICVNDERVTRPLRHSDRLPYLDNVLARLKSFHLRRCTRERNFAGAIMAGLPRSASMISFIKLPLDSDSLLEQFSINESPHVDPWEGAVPLTL
ncbi:hypothetical protein LshimejAT787_0310570 [Lyophyllum shimeji]|uniref:F-box domain-containing protein n=1 Tax=Lyophyllum shimeji TaxID=47721 RepID=A0A9P3PIV9_LYOSH|nr:hypothetical protein LshimejAT787_0310570 [Lyophyllum shimeji]